MREYKSKVVNLIEKLLLPVNKNLGFFITIFCCIISVPLTASIILKARMLHFILSTFTQAIFIAYIFCLLSLCIQNLKLRKILQIFIIAMFSFWMLLDIGCLIITGRVITSESVRLIVESNSTEAINFFKQYFTLNSLVKLIIYFFVFIISLIFTVILITRLEKNKSLKLLFTIVLIFGLIGGIIEHNRLKGFFMIQDLEMNHNWDGTYRNNPDLTNAFYMLYSNPILKICYIIKSLNLEIKNIKEWEEFQKKTVKRLICSKKDTDKFDIVLIIGESFIRTHSSLYGYYLNTNPKLKYEKEKENLFVFSDIVCPANQTTVSLRNVLNLNDLSKGEQWYRSPYLPLILKKAGVNIYHFDNQTVSANSDVGIGKMFYADFIKNDVLDMVNDRVFDYDGPYVDYVQNNLSKREKSGRKLIIYHLLGQHFKYSERFPDKPYFNLYDIRNNENKLDNNKRQSIADYNNATLYNDSVVSNILKYYSNKEVIAIYFSDHGEDSYEFGPVRGRDLQFPDDPAWLDRQFHIPFFVWVSDEFKRSYPEKVEAIKKAVNRPWSTDNLGQMVLGLCEIKTKYYRPERDILSDKFKPYERKTASGYNYDSICNRK